jgi:hypothetical protein
MIQAGDSDWGPEGRAWVASGQQTGSNRSSWEPSQSLEDCGGLSERSGVDTWPHLRLSEDPSGSLTIRCTGPRRLVGFDTEEVTGSKPVAPTRHRCRSERRRSVIGGALVVPRVAWGHAGATAGPPRQPHHRARWYRLGSAVEHVQAVAQSGISLQGQMAVAVQGEAHRGMPGPGRDLLGVAPAAIHTATAVCRRSWMHSPSRPAAMTAGGYTDRGTPAAQADHPAVP